MMQAYLDNSATTKPCSQCVDAMVRSMQEDYYNPSALYAPAMKGEQILKEAAVLAVLNTFCAMISSRSYREGMNEGVAIRYLEDSSCFDQTVVAHLKTVMKTPDGIYAARS